MIIKWKIFFLFLKNSETKSTPLKILYEKVITIYHTCLNGKLFWKP